MDMDGQKRMEKGATVKTKIAKIEWQDASDDGKSWSKPGEFAGLVDITTVGILYEENDNEVIIAHSVSSTGDLGGVFHIPKGSVKDISYLCEV